MTLANLVSARSFGLSDAPHMWTSAPGDPGSTALPAQCEVLLAQANQRVCSNG